MPIRTVLAAFTCGLAIAACGSSADPTARASGGDLGLRFAQCMRAHGVPNFPDPGPGGGLDITPSSGLNPQSPAFRSAQQSCNNLLPEKGAPPPMTAGERAEALRFAQCMRANGQPDFPDPTLRTPSGASRILVLRGMQFAPGPGLDPKSPAFRRAALRCGVSTP